MVVLITGVQGEGFGEDDAIRALSSGWIIRRAEGTAIAAMIERLLDASKEFYVHAGEGGRQAKRKKRGYGRINWEAGKLLRVADQIQLVIMNALRNKMKCQMCKRWIVKA